MTGFLKKVEALQVRLKNDAANLGIVTVNTINGPVTFSSWDDLCAKGKGLKIQGDWDLEYTDVAKLPEDLRLTGMLSIEGCKQLKEIPAGLKSIGVFAGASGVERIGPRVHVDGMLVVRDCKHLKTLPPDLRCAKLRAQYSGLETIPLEVAANVTGVISLFKCLSLKTLPKGFKTSGDLNLSASGIESLPEGLEVGGILSVDLCPNLKSLPKGLKVHGDLDPGLLELPEDIEVFGSVYGWEFEDGRWQRKAGANLERLVTNVLGYGFLHKVFAKTEALKVRLKHDAGGLGLWTFEDFMLELSEAGDLSQPEYFFEGLSEKDKIKFLQEGQRRGLITKPTKGKEGGSLTMKGERWVQKTHFGYEEVRNEATYRRKCKSIAKDIAPHAIAEAKDRELDALTVEPEELESQKKSAMKAAKELIPEYNYGEDVRRYLAPQHRNWQTKFAKDILVEVEKLLVLHFKEKR